MDDVKGLCAEWQSLLENFRELFTLGGWVRFAQWATGTVLCSEEHTIMQILTGLCLKGQWRNVEHFAEYGAWDREAVERRLMRLIEQTIRPDLARDRVIARRRRCDGFAPEGRKTAAYAPS
jgi:hypothetical protein